MMAAPRRREKTAPTPTSRYNSRLNFRTWPCGPRTMILTMMHLPFCSSHVLNIKYTFSLQYWHLPLLPCTLSWCSTVVFWSTTLLGAIEVVSFHRVTRSGRIPPRVISAWFMAPPCHTAVWNYYYYIFLLFTAASIVCTRQFPCNTPGIHCHSVFFSVFANLVVIER